MKVHFLFIFIVFASMSCTRDVFEELSMMESPKQHGMVLTKSLQETEYEALKIIDAGYIEFDNYQYRLKISLEEAIELGYSLDSYNYMDAQLHLANEQILQDIANWENDPNINEWHIDDCTYSTTSIVVLPSLKTRQEQTVTMPSGSISATLGAPGGVSIFAPNGMKGINGHCFSNVALVGWSEVRTEFFGGVHSARRWGNGNLSVAIAASNTYGTIQFTTSDSNGGTYSWYGYL